MAESNDRFYSGDVSNEDMAEAPRRQKESAGKTVVQGIAVVVALLCLAVILIRGSQPAMTPEQIVQQQDYEGEQRARRIFNLYSLKQDRARRDVERTEIVAQGEAAERATGTVVTAKSLASDEQDELPQAASSPKSYEKAELSREVPAQVISQVQASPTQRVASVEPVETRSEPKVLPVYSLKSESAILRESPEFGARQIVTISGEQTVTLFDTTGVWAQVAANDGSGRTGYILRSELISPEN